jgi:hypothetical protein
MVHYSFLRKKLNKRKPHFFPSAAIKILDGKTRKRDNNRCRNKFNPNHVKEDNYMKIVRFALVIVFLLASTLAFSQTVRLMENFSSPSLKGWTLVSGNWQVINGRLTQTNTQENMAMITIPVYQSGKMLYEFDLRYVDGGQDDYAGFGIHVCVNDPTNTRSWGNGESVLGWVTWDPKHYGYPGGYIQLYESRSKTQMELDRRIYPGGNPLKYGDLIVVPAGYLKYEYLNATVPMKLMLDTATGEGRFYDPFDPDRYYYPFYLGRSIKPGGFLTFRTNSVSISIDNLKVTRMY